MCSILCTILSCCGDKKEFYISFGYKKRETNIEGKTDQNENETSIKKEPTISSSSKNNQYFATNDNNKNIKKEQSNINLEYQETSQIVQKHPINQLNLSNKLPELKNANSNNTDEKLDVDCSNVGTIDSIVDQDH